LVALGPEIASNIFKHLDEYEIELLSREIGNLRDVSAEDKERVLAEFHKAFCTGASYTFGGVDYLKEILFRAVGKAKADDILHRLYVPYKRGLGKLRNIDPAGVAELIVEEHPQTICLILSRLKPSLAAAIFAEFPRDLQGEVALRMATMEKISPSLAKDVERVFQEQIEDRLSGELSFAGGAKAVADILNQTERPIEKQILEVLEEKSPEIANEVKKYLMFAFEDIVTLEDRAVQRVLQQVDVKQLSLALKAAGDDIKEKILNNLSERAAEMVKEEIEYMGPVRLRDVEQAQHYIAKIIRRLEDEGEIVVMRGGEEIVV